MTRGELAEMAQAMVLAKLFADGKRLADISKEEMEQYVRDAVADLKLAVGVTGTEIS